MTITEFIKTDLAKRISADGGQNGSLTLVALAKHYSVSITPVRAAVQELVDEGILQKGANRRLGVNPGRAAVQSASADAIPGVESPGVESRGVESSSVESRGVESSSVESSGVESRGVESSSVEFSGAVAYCGIKGLGNGPDPFQEISDYAVRLSIEGESVFLREQATAKQFGITRSAVRQIFAGLAGHGMIEHIPRRGWQVRPLREKDLDEYIEMRILLEVKALQLARPHLVDDDIRRLLGRNHLPESPTDEPLIDDRLHPYIIQKAGNRYLTDFFDRNSKYFVFLFSWEVLDRETRIQTVRQHRDILEAILQKDWPLAESALRFHLQHNHPLLRKFMRERSSKQTSPKAPR